MTRLFVAVNSYSTMETTTATFAELRAWLNRTGTSQKDLANILQVSEPSITQYMNGTNEWPVEIAVRISLLTDVPVERLVNRKTARLLKLWGSRTNASAEMVAENVKDA